MNQIKSTLIQPIFYPNVSAPAPTAGRIFYFFPTKANFEAHNGRRKVISNPYAKKHSQTWPDQGISPLNHLYERGLQLLLPFGPSGHQ